jgi:hypothetical protein
MKISLEKVLKSGFCIIYLTVSIASYPLLALRIWIFLGDVFKREFFAGEFYS